MGRSDGGQAVRVQCVGSARSCTSEKPQLLLIVGMLPTIWYSHGTTAFFLDMVARSWSPHIHRCLWSGGVCQVLADF